MHVDSDLPLRKSRRHTPLGLRNGLATVPNISGGAHCIDMIIDSPIWSALNLSKQDSTPVSLVLSRMSYSLGVYQPPGHSCCLSLRLLRLRAYVLAPQLRSVTRRTSTTRSASFGQLQIRDSLALTFRYSDCTYFFPFCP